MSEAPVRLQVKAERDLSEAATTREHQGVVAWAEPYPYADAYGLAAGDRPLIAALDQVSVPRNLGAVARSAEGKGLRPLVRKACDAAVSIPLLGRVESLNVSVAASLLLYEARRQRG